jgi:predicted lipoprotein with Yx(FWY)xxD motif
MRIGVRPLGLFVRLTLAVAMLVVLRPAQDEASAQDEPRPTILLVEQEDYGSILTDPDGWALYRWEGDSPGVSNCADACAVIWPPYVTEAEPVAPEGLPGTLGLLDRGEEGSQVTFDGWPLYYFALDGQPGDLNGDQSMGFGARWSVVAFAAPPVTPEPPVTALPPPAQPTPLPTLAPPPVVQPTAPPTSAPPPPATATSAPVATPIPPPTAPVPASGPAGAVEGPQFGNWGPGQAPPDQEGLGPSGSSGAPTAPGSAAAPFAAPAPGAVAPVPSYGGCYYDLRGYWTNNGQQTTGGYRSYSASVYVRQYGAWVYGQQDDGTGYYGRCTGNRLQLDVYRGYQYVGRQSGTVSGTYYPYPYPYGDVPPYAAPAAPPPSAGSGLRADFVWTTVYGSGSETWLRR